MRIADIKIGVRARRDPGDIESLATSIQQVGLLHPVVISPDGTLVSGYRRIKAFEVLGRDEIPNTVVKSLNDTTLALKAEVDENVQRKDLSPLEAAEMAKRLEVVELEAAQKRADEGRKRGGRTRHDASLRKHFPVAGKRAADQIASAVGYSRPTLEKAKAVAQAAQDDPEHYGKLAEEMDATGKVDPAFKKLKKMSASNSGEETHKDNKIRSWNAGLKNIQRFIDQIEKEGGPASILDVTLKGARQGCALRLLRMAEAFRNWVVLLDVQLPATESLSGDDHTTMEPGDGETSSAYEEAAPGSQEHSAQHIETKNQVVTLSEGSSRRDGWERHDKKFFADYSKRVGKKPKDVAEELAQEVSVADATRLHSNDGGTALTMVASPRGDNAQVHRCGDRNGRPREEGGQQL